MASGHSCPPAGPPAKVRPLAKQDVCKIIKQAVAPQAPSPPAAPPVQLRDLEEYSRQRRPPGMPGFGPAKMSPPPGMPAFGPAVAPPEWDWRPALKDKLQQLRTKQQLREGRCDHWAHLQSEPSSSSGPLVATVGTGAPSSRPLAATGLHQAGDPKTRRPLAAGDPKTLGQDVAEYVETQRQTPGAWKPSYIATKRMHVDCCIRHRLHEELGKQLEGQTAGMLCHIMAGTNKDIKALCIPLVGNKPRKIGDSLDKALEKHPLVCPSSIGRKVLKTGMHQLEFTDKHNSTWVILLLAMPERDHSPIRNFVAVLQKWNPLVKMTLAESATLGNLLCSLTGHEPPYPNAMGGISSGDPNVGNDLAQATANHDSEQSAIGDVSVRDSSGPLGDDVPDSGDDVSDSGSEKGSIDTWSHPATPDADFGVSDDDSESPDAGAQDDCAMGSDDEARTPEDDPHVDPDRGGGDLL